jgi:hypothetical protein
MPPDQHGRHPRHPQRWYLRYNLSYRDVEELLAERGIEADHVTVYRWVQRFTPLLADAARFARHCPGGRPADRAPLPALAPKSNARSPT